MIKKFTILLLYILLSVCAIAQVHVRGYTKANGTYVAPYTRSSPDKNPTNNYSYPGNTNPYTGKVATGNPNTYLSRYYGGQSIVIDGKYDIASNSHLTGSYMKCYILNKDESGFLIYNYDNTFNGYVLVYSNGKMEVFDKTSTLSHTYNDGIESNPITISTSNPISSDNNSSSAIYPKIDYQSNENTDYSSNPQKEYLKDLKGNYTGDYLQLEEINNEYKKYKWYNLNDFPKGFFMVYSNGQKVYFDLYGNVLKRIVNKKRKL